MSIIISFLTIGLIKSVWSASSNKVCVYGSPMVNGEWQGIQGEYTYGDLDENGNEYWTKPVSDNCNASIQQGDTVYIRYSTMYDEWEIAPRLEDNCYFYKCDTHTTLPSECDDNNWYGVNGVLNDFYIITGECPPSKSETYLNVTDYDSYYLGCNGEFQPVSGKKDLYKRMEDYDYGWKDDNGNPRIVPHYWLYSIYQQEWVCDIRDLEDESMSDYSHGCYIWSTKDGMDMIFHD